MRERGKSTLSKDVKFAENGSSTEGSGKQNGKAGEEPSPTRERWRRRWRSLKSGVKFIIILALLVAVAWIFRSKIFVTVDAGEVLVVYYRFFGGTSHNSIGHEGLHFLAPWDKSYIYSTRTQTLLKPMTVLSRNGLEVHLDAQIRFHLVPEIIPYLHRRYGPEIGRAHV